VITGAAGGVIFTSPYVSAGGASDGMLVMTAAAPIYHDAAKTIFAGVVAIDFSVADLDQSILVSAQAIILGSIEHRNGLDQSSSRMLFERLLVITG
jgi:sensor histidine kinase regulating citrate/malate metabolism